MIDNIELIPDCYSERDAAMALGFDELAWDNWSNKEEQPASLSKTWDELTSEEEKAATFLGYTKLMWDSQLPPAIQKYWADLTDAEMIAATALGYNEVNWDNMSGEEEQPPNSTKPWALMSDEQLTALEVLGYTETSFGQTYIELPDLMDLPWHDLTTCGEIPPLTHPPLRRTV